MLMDTIRNRMEGLIGSIAEPTPAQHVLAATALRVADALDGAGEEAAPAYAWGPLIRELRACVVALSPDQDGDVTRRDRIDAALDDLLDSLQ